MLLECKAPATSKLKSIFSLEQEMEAQNEVSETLRAELRGNIEDLKDDLQQAVTEAAYLRQYETGYAELEASECSKLPAAAVITTLHND